MTTMADLVNATRIQASQGVNDQVNVLASSYEDGEEDLSFRFATDAIAPGMTLSAGLRVWQVMDIAPLARSVTVIASPDGSGNGNLPAGQVVRVRPRFTDWHIFTLLNREIVEMSSPAHGLFGIVEWTQMVTQAGDVYPVDPGISANLLDVAATYLVRAGAREARNWSDYAVMNTEFGTAIRVVDTDGLSSGGTLTFIGKRAFSPADLLTDDPVTWCGLSETMLDIPSLGAAAYLLWAGEGRRAQLIAQGDTRRPEEIPATAASSIAANLFRQRDQRIRAEYARLMQAYPPITGRW